MSGIARRTASCSCCSSRDARRSARFSSSSPAMSISGTAVMAMNNWTAMTASAGVAPANRCCPRSALEIVKRVVHRSAHDNPGTPNRTTAHSRNGMCAYSHKNATAALPVVRAAMRSVANNPSSSRHISPRRRADGREGLGQRYPQMTRISGSSVNAAIAFDTVRARHACQKSGAHPIRT